MAIARRASTRRFRLDLAWGCLKVGLDGHQQSLVRDRGLRSPTLCRCALSAGLLTDEPFGWREAIGGLLIVAAGALESYDAIRRQPAGS